jgi:hypothetical protein
MAKWSKSPAVMQQMIVGRLHDTVVIAYYTFITKLIQRTPKLTGQLKNNWRSSLNAPSMIIQWGPSTAGEESFQSARRAMQAFQLGDKITLRNRMPYGPKIEFEGWSKSKAPNGMLRITMVEWPQIVAGAVRQVKSGAGSEAS